MSRLRWILSALSAPFLRERSTPLVRPARLDWNLSLSPQTIQTNGHTIFYTVKGAGRPLVLIHGYGAGMWVWEKQIEVLSQGYNVYALDLIGHGFSDRPKIPYTPETYIHCLKDFMDGVGIEKASLVGNSMGGGVAWATAILCPERVDRLILIDCVPPDVLREVKNESFRMLAAIKDIPALPYLVMAVRNRNSIKKVLLECVSDINLITPEVVNRQYQLSRIKGTTRALYSTFSHAREALKLKDQFSRIRKPTLFIWGEKDLIFPPQLGEKLHRGIVGSKFRVIKNSGHIPMWETPDEVNRAILDFLQE
ncbi:MAG TPA: alpha/beta hydrolase [Thermodesulfobacteriota bacterium]|nr:alpha/beta hydrolase [Thermodesulfobacteriota bacterium]